MEGRRFLTGAEEHLVCAALWKWGLWAGHGLASSTPAKASTALPRGACRLQCSTQSVGDGFAMKCDTLASSLERAVVSPVWSRLQMWISSRRVTHGCSYSLLFPCAGLLALSLGSLPWITSQVPWGHTCRTCFVAAKTAHEAEEHHPAHVWVGLCTKGCLWLGSTNIPQAVGALSRCRGSSLLLWGFLKVILK